MRSREEGLPKMKKSGNMESGKVLAWIKAQAQTENYRITKHFQEAMVEEEIGLQEILEALSQAEIVESYPEHRRGACSLLSGVTAGRRPLHIVCTTQGPKLVLITVYEPMPPKWTTPKERGQEG